MAAGVPIMFCWQIFNNLPTAEAREYNAYLTLAPTFWFQILILMKKTFF
jgi:hypothetical protein